MTRWMEIAEGWKEVGVKEVRGGENEDILGFFKAIKKPEFNEDEIPWCAAFVGACLYDANYGHNGSAWAAHYGIWEGADEVASRRTTGIAPGMAEYGDILVMTRNGGGHVCFFVKDNGNGTFDGLGGNQADSVNVTAQNWSRVQKIMRPNGKGKPKKWPDKPAGYDPDAPVSAPETSVPVVTVEAPVAPSKPLNATEIGIGAAGGVAALSTADLATMVIVALIVVAVVYLVWKKRQ